MNRFTARQDDGVVYCKLWNTATCENQCDGCSINDDMLGMLARYEDTNLTPDEIDTMVATFIALMSIEYGKQRFFQQDDGSWYDRNDGSYVPMATVILRSYEAIARNIREE